VNRAIRTHDGADLIHFVAQFWQSCFEGASLLATVGASSTTVRTNTLVHEQDLTYQEKDTVLQYGRLT